MNIPNKINGRTPEEIKKGLECCSPQYKFQHWVLCSSECPFRNEGAYCRNVLNTCIKRYIQQLERERDAAVEIIAGDCDECKHRPEKWLYDCRMNDFCVKCCTNDYCNWQWRGVQEVKSNA